MCVQKRRFDHRFCLCVCYMGVFLGEFMCVAYSACGNAVGVDALGGLEEGVPVGKERDRVFVLHMGLST